VASAATVNAEVMIVFLTGSQALPDSHGLGVYLSLEQTHACPDTFEYIGFLCNGTKESGFRRGVTSTPSGALSTLTTMLLFQNRVVETLLQDACQYSS
jgi:hypothetical protein